MRHDPVALMSVFDQMPRRLRDEINERGLEQDIFDRLPDSWRVRIARAMGLDVEDDVADVWDD